MDRWHPLELGRSILGHVDFTRGIFQPTNKEAIMICVVNAFNGTRIVSRHRTARAAYRAEQRFQRATERANGRGSYIPTAFWLSGPRGQFAKIDIYEHLQLEGVAYDEL